MDCQPSVSPFFYPVPAHIAKSFAGHTGLYRQRQVLQVLS